ncbi:hypothetical protein VCHA30O60_40294 [Vibrio chagasii]|nr:hypothetical protein VCHA30O60_40294 [Vibrio chagasii]
MTNDQLNHDWYRLFYTQITQYPQINNHCKYGIYKIDLNHYLDK